MRLMLVKKETAYESHSTPTPQSQIHVVSRMKTHTQSTCGCPRLNALASTANEQPLGCNLAYSSTRGGL